MLSERYAYNFAVLQAPTGAVHTNSIDADAKFCKCTAQNHTLGSARPNRNERSAWGKQNSFPKFCRPPAVGGQVKASYRHTDHVCA